MTLLSSAGGGIVLAPTKIEGSFVSDTMIVAFVATFVILILGLLVKFVFVPRWSKDLTKVGKFQSILESITDMFTSSARNTVGHNADFVGPWYFAMSIFIFVGVALEMFGLRPAMTDMNLNLVLGLMTFFIIHFYGFRVKRWGRLKHYALVITTISDLVLPISVALRLFGSVFSGFVIMHLIYSLPIGFHFVLPAIGTIMFTLFHAAIQSYVYMLLSMNLIAEATE